MAVSICYQFVSGFILLLYYALMESLLVTTYLSGSSCHGRPSGG